MKFLYHSQMATILVGPEHEVFMVHKPLLCSKSQYFNKALNGSFEESRTGIVKLEDVSPVFRIIVTWLYNGEIVYTASDDNSNIEEDFRGWPYPYLKPYTPLPVDKDTSTWPKGALTGLYVLADRLDIKELRIASIDALVSGVHKSGIGLCVFDCHYIDANTTAESPLRKFALDQLAYVGRHSMADKEFWEKIPHGMAITALLIVGQRVPPNLCTFCYKRGLFANHVSFDDNHPCKTNDIALYKTDSCFYHEHADDEEKKACRTRHSKTVVGLSWAGTQGLTSQV